MIVKGHFIGDAPYFAAVLRGAQFHGMVWFLADTGASHTTLLDRDTKIMNIPEWLLEPAPEPTIGIGGSVPSFLVRNVEIIFTSEGKEEVIPQDLRVVKHDLERLSPEEASCILRLPSLLGRDLINRFKFTCCYITGIVQLEL